MHKSFYLVHDCETGGLDFTKNPITQYACVILDPFTLKEVDRYETFVKPYDDLVIEKQALEHTMVSMSDIKNGITRKKLYETLKTIYTNYQAKGKYKDANRIVSVGHNVTFDHGFIDYVFQSQGDSMWNYFQPTFVDTLVLAKLMWGLTGDEKLNLTACSERAKIKLSDAHGAMNDVEATADLLRYFAKKLRSGKSESSVSESSKRERGQKFFEFACGAK